MLIHLWVILKQETSIKCINFKKKALYGLKQALQAWYGCKEAYFLKKGFQKCHYEHTLFMKFKASGKIFIVYLYVDDLIHTSNDKVIIEQFKIFMMTEFDMFDLGLMHYFLGIEVIQSARCIFISQKRYEHDILTRF